MPAGIATFVPRALAPRAFVGGALVLGLLAAATPNDSASADERPNIVVLLADDLGFGDVKCFGRERCQIETPNFDRLAAEGVRFTDAHAIACVCIPSRIGIMTGRYAWRFAPPRPNGPWGYVNPYLAADQYTLARLCRDSGYQTGYVGKWHLGLRMQTTDGANQGPGNVDFREPLLVGPPQFGFHASFILPGSLDMYPYAFARNNRWQGEVTARKGWSAFNRIGAAAEDFEDVKVLDTFSREAEAFIESHATRAKAGKPFFLYLALTAPHTPLSPRAKFSGKSKLGVYGDFVMETDDCLGRVMRSLEKHGVADNTLVIATSDHGAASYAGAKRVATAGQNREMQKQGHYSSGPFRGYKFSVYEGGFRVPFVARWPKVTPPNTECRRLIGLQDLLATFADVLGVDLGDRGPDSMSLLPLFREPQAEATRSSLILQATRGFAVRTEQWKLALCPGSGSQGRWGNTPAADAAWRQAIDRYGKRVGSREELAQAPFVQLFHLPSDIGEKKNLAGDKPEQVQAMLSILKRQIVSGRSRPGPKLTNDRPVRAFPSVPAFVWKKNRN